MRRGRAYFERRAVLGRLMVILSVSAQTKVMLLALHVIGERDGRVRRAHQVVLDETRLIAAIDVLVVVIVYDVAFFYFGQLGEIASIEVEFSAGGSILENVQIRVARRSQLGATV